MAFHKEKHTITIGKDSDFMVDSGLYFINMLRSLSKNENPVSEIVEDWQAIEKWLKCEGRELSQEDEERISRAWKSYLAIGLAPSFKLQPVFDLHSKKYKEAGYSFEKDKPPTAIMDVFDRLMATKEEIQEKKKYDWNKEKENFERILKSTQNLTLKQKLASVKKNTRVLAVVSVAWFSWVTFRTSDDYELLGMYLDQWDEDMLLANLIIPLLVLWLASKSYKWIKSAEK